MIWLKILSIAIPAIIAVCEIWKAHQETPKSRKRPGVAIFLVVATFICTIIAGIIMYRDDRDATAQRKQDDERQARTEQWQTNTTSDLARLGALQNDDASREKLFGIIRAATTRYNAETTPVQEFLSSRDLRTAAREQEATINTEVLKRELVRIQPLSEFIVNRFDSWFAGLEGKHGRVTIQSNDIAPLHIKGETRAKEVTVRRAIFEKGGEVSLYIHQGIISEGKLAPPVRVQMHATTPFILSDPVWQISIAENGYELMQVGGPVKYKPYQGTMPDPMTDKDFMRAMEKSFDETIGWVIDDAAAERKEDKKQ